MNTDIKTQVNEEVKSYDSKNRLTSNTETITKIFTDTSVETSSYKLTVLYKDSENVTVKIFNNNNKRRTKETLFRDKNIRKIEEFVNNESEPHREEVFKIVDNETELIIWKKERQFEYTYIYDNDNNLLTIVIVNNITKAKSYVCYEYDEYNNKIRYTTTDKKSKDYRIRYTYYENGQIRSKYKTYDKSKQYKYIRYDMAGRIIFESDDNGSSKEFRYNADGRVVYEKRSYYIKSHIKCVEEEISSYEDDIDSNGNRIIIMNTIYKRHEYNLKMCNKVTSVHKSHICKKYAILNGKEEIILHTITDKNKHSYRYEVKYEKILEEYLKTHIYVFESSVLGSDNYTIEETSINYCIKNDKIQEKLEQNYHECLDSGSKSSKQFTKLWKYEYDKNNNVVKSTCTTNYIL